ncbi:hypothetical protein [Micromonospora costi]|uniref:Uncharacterized protein n=1 Tax=Micromonospora costi TaxID=1530042 RepID=A0A3A9ZYJ8_9ACTN|nr:hypothetical protein [Micromonospora costi]RKN53180.1 hypothetical protein D7193_25765 [Micromonospora costi]
MERIANGDVAVRQADQVRLREATTSGDFIAGQRLIEADLVTLRGASRNAAWLAVDSLMVDRITNRGARVRTVSTAETVAVSACRMALDGLIAVKAAPHATDAEVGAPRVHALRIRQAAQAGELTTSRRPGPT